MKIEELSKKIDKYHEENSDMEWRKLGLLAGGFALATLNLFLDDRTIANAAIPIFFLAIGLISFFVPAFRKKKGQKK